MGKCLVCEQEAIAVRPFEILPNNAIAMDAIHDNNIKHTWTEYRSQNDLGRKLVQSPREMTCPMCGKKGRLGSYRKDNLHQEFVTYYIKHGRDQTNRGTHYITNPKQREQLIRRLGRYIEISGGENGKAEIPAINRALNLNLSSSFSNTDNDESKNIRSIEELGKEDENPNLGHVGQPKRRGLTFVPKGKRLTTCTVCKRPGYKYNTYFQHYNLPPVRRIILHGKDMGPWYERCYPTKTKEKHDDSNRQSNLDAKQGASVKSFQDQVLQKLDTYIEEVSSSKSLGMTGKTIRKCIST
jgi:hypothetical protein